MHTDSFIVHVKRKDIYAYISRDVETRFGTLNIDLERSLRIRKNKKVINLMKNKLVIRIMKGFIALRRKIYTYLTDYGHVVKKAKSTKNSVIKRVIKFQDYKDCLENKKIFNS